MNLKGKLLVATIAVGGLTAGAYAIAQSSNTTILEQSEKETEEKIKIEIINGEKKVTVTTTENGIETTKVYEGEEAEAFLKDHHASMHMEHKGSGHHKIMMMMMDEFDIDDIEGLDEETIEKIHEAIGNIDIDIDIDGENVSWFSDCEGKDHAKCKMEIVIDGDMDEFHEEMKNFHIDMEEIHDMMNDMKIDIQTEEDGEHTFKKIIIISNGKDGEVSKEITDVEVDDDMLKIYPNPSTGKFAVETKGKEGATTKLSVIDMNGKVVLSKELKGEGNLTENIDLKKQSPGNYIITIEQGNRILKEKILIK